MPIYEIQDPSDTSGRIYELDAPDQATALAEFKAYMASQKPDRPVSEIPQIPSNQGAVEQPAQATSVPHMEAQLRGLTLGLSDPAIAAGRAAVGSLLGGSPFTQGYQDEWDRIQAGKRQTGMLGQAEEMIASMGTGGMGAAGPAIGLGKQTVIGGTMGALYGTTQPEISPTQGALFGAAAPLAIKAGEQVISRVTPAVGELAEPLMKRTPAGMKAAKAVNKAMKKRGLETDDVVREMVRTGGGTTPIEVTGSPGIRLATELGISSPEQRNRTVDFMVKRLGGGYGRVQADLKRLMGRDGATHYQNVKALQKARIEQSEPYYRQSFTEKVKSDDMLDTWLKWSGYIHSGLPEEQIAPITNQTLRRKVMRFGDRLVDEQKRFRTDVGSLHNVQTEIRERLDTLYRKQQYGSQEAKILRHMRGDLLDIMERNSENYAKGRDLYRHHSDFLRAGDLGKNVLKEEAEITADEFARMSLSEREVYLHGAASAMRAATRDYTPMHLIRNDRIRERVLPMFPDEQSFEEFINVSLMREHNIMDVTNRIIRASKEDLERSTDLPWLASEAIKYGWRPVVAAVARLMGRNVGKYSPEVSKQINNILLEGDPREFSLAMGKYLDAEDQRSLIAELQQIIRGAGTGAVVTAAPETVQ